MEEQIFPGDDLSDIKYRMLEFEFETKDTLCQNCQHQGLREREWKCRCLKRDKLTIWRKGRNKDTSLKLCFRDRWGGDILYLKVMRDIILSSTVPSRHTSRIDRIWGVEFAGRRERSSWPAGWSRWLSNGWRSWGWTSPAFAARWKLDREA
jgi:hypothetical protein